ncbi:hypothetical protein ACV22V_31685 [Burkholderia sp. AW33-5]
MWSVRAQRECMNAVIDWLRDCQAIGLHDCQRLVGAGAQNGRWQNWMTELGRATFESVRSDGGMGKAGRNWAGSAAH